MSIDYETSRASRVDSKPTDRPYFLISGVITVVILATVLSFPQFFLFIPFDGGLNFLAFMGFLTLLGWIGLAVIPPIVLLGRAETLSRFGAVLLAVSVLIYPLSTSTIKIYGLATTGQFWGQYLFTYPILLALEWLLPIFYLYIALRVYRGAKNR